MPFLIAPFYRYLIIAGVALAAMMWAYRKGVEHEKNRNAVFIVQQQEVAAEQTKKLQQAKDEAINNATKRAQQNEIAASTARTESERLRIQIASIKRDVPNIARDAVDSYASALADVFDDCQQKYQNLAAEADKLASDRQTLIDAWPQSLGNGKWAAERNSPAL